MDGKKSILHRRVGYLFPSKTKGFYGSIYLDQSGRMVTKEKAVSVEKIYGMIQNGKINLFIASGSDYADNFRQKYGHKGANYGGVYGVKKEINKGLNSKRGNIIKMNRVRYIK